MIDCGEKHQANGVKKPTPDQAVSAGGRSTKVVKQKPIVLSSQRYARLMNNATSGERLRNQKEAAEEEKYQEYLRKGSDDLVAQFKGNMPRTQDQKVEQLKENLERKRKEANDIYMASKENDARERKEKIVKAQQLVEKLKPGPRSLHAAAMQSEVLRVRNVQRSINEEFERAIRQQEVVDKAACHKQAMPWIQEEQQRLNERQNSVNQYKREMLQSIDDTAKQRKEQQRATIKEEQAARDAMDVEIRAQIEREKALMEKKRATLRKNALEAMKMVEQRRLRERMTEEVEDRLCCVYNTGKRQLDTLKREHAQQVVAERKQRSDVNSQRLAGMQSNNEAAESARLRRDISRLQLKFTVEEQEKIRKEKAAKQARIEAHLREMRQLKEAQQLADEERHFDMAQRYKNDEVNGKFAEAQKQRRQRRVHDTRAELDEQVAYRQRTAAEERAIELALHRKDNCNAKEDRFFFEYARNLIEDAHKKQRPLQPFVKAVEQYKRENRIDCAVRTPKHLVSRLSIGCRQAGDSKAEAVSAANQAANEACTVAGKDRENIVENCLKITELLTNACRAEDGACGGGDGQQMVECARHGRSSKAGRADGLGDCVSLTPSGNVRRYSMTELKQLNRFED